MSWNTTCTSATKFTKDGESRAFCNSVAITSNTKATENSGTSDNSGWDTLYDASQTSVPPIGNDDAGDVPFLFHIRITGGEDAYLKITDSAGGITYCTVKNGHELRLLNDMFGSTTATHIEQIDIQSTSATDTEYTYVRQHD